MPVSDMALLVISGASCVVVPFVLVASLAAVVRAVQGWALSAMEGSHEDTEN